MNNLGAYYAKMDMGEACKELIEAMESKAKIKEVEVAKREFEIWSEGYVATGNASRANFHGVFKESTFAKACKVWAKTLRQPEYFDEKRLTLWGCKLFDNEEDARKSFG